MPQTLVAEYKYYVNISEFNKNISLLTYSAVNSNRIDTNKCSIFYTYNSKGEINGEQAYQLTTIPSLNAPNLYYIMASFDFNLYDKVIVFNITTGSIYDSNTSKFIFDRKTLYNFDYLGNPIEIHYLPDDPKFPDRINRLIKVFSK